MSKEALSQTEQRSNEHLKERSSDEPVATLDDLEQEIYENTRQFVSRDVMEWMLKRYYTTPPQRDSSATPRTWVGLTTEEIEMIVENRRAAHWEFVRQVEAKLKEKNNVSR